jgi:hypothetical protein
MFEAATITYLVGSGKSPALLFENIKGHPGHKALYKIGIDFGGDALELTQHLDLLQPQIEVARVGTLRNLGCRRCLGRLFHYYSV